MSRAAWPDSGARNAWLGHLSPSIASARRSVSSGVPEASTFDHAMWPSSKSSCFRATAVPRRKHRRCGADARNTRLETGGEEKALERHPVCGIRDLGPFGWLGEDSIDDDGISRGRHAPRFFREQGVDPGCRLDGVTPVRQPVSFVRP